MKVLGYFPGVDFDSSDQFGRRVHVKELVRNFNEIYECSALFLIGSPAGEFEHINNVRDAGYSNSTFGRMLYELYRCVYVTWFVQAHDIELIYTRDSPYFAPALVNLLTGVDLVVEANGIPEDEGGEARRQRIKKRVFNWLRRTKRSSASKIIAVSDGIRDHLLAEDSTYRIDVIENGVEIERFKIHSPVSATPPYTICYVGGLQRWQGIETMIEIVAGMENDVEFIIIGGTEQRCKELSSLAEAHGIGSDVAFLGRVPHQQVPHYINKADLCFGPFVKSRKASPLKIYEYVACGRKVIYVNETGLERLETIPGVYNFDYELSVEELAKEVDEVLVNLETNQDGRDYITANCSWEAVVNSVWTSIRCC